MRHIMMATLLMSVTIAGMVAQENGLPQFEVASVKPSPSGDDRTIWDNPAAETFAVTNAPLRSLVARAYAVEAALERFVLLGGSEKILSTRFDVRAKPSVGATPAQRNLMLRALLVSRFHLRTHTETRELETYALSVVRESKFGPNFAKSEFSCLAWRAARSQASKNGTEIPQEPKDRNGVGWCTKGYDFSRRGVMTLRDAGPIDELARKLQAFLDRPLVEITNLDGNFEWQLAFSQPGNPPGDSEFPSLPLAIVEQLGLRITPRTGPTAVLVIDGIEMPSPN